MAESKLYWNSLVGEFAAPLALYNPKSNSEKFVLSPRLESMRASYFHLLLTLSMFSAMCYHRRKETNEHFTKVAGFYFSKWIGMSLYSRTHKILLFMFNNDFLGLQNCSPAHRRERGIFYSNCFHHILRYKERCYESADDETCSCKYCG